MISRGGGGGEAAAGVESIANSVVVEVFDNRKGFCRWLKWLLKFFFYFMRRENTLQYIYFWFWSN